MMSERTTDNKIDDIHRTVAKLINNDLPHIHYRLTALEAHHKWQMSLLVGIIVTVVAFGLAALASQAR